MNLTGKKVLVTGGSLGIGRATAALLIEKGAQVAITGRNAARLEATAKAIGALPILGDVAREEDVAATFATLQETWGGLDVLINNAGIGGEFKVLTEQRMDDLRKVYEVNVFGAANMAQHAAKIFKAQQHGAIINIGSTASLRGFARGGVYASSKFALRGMTQCWQAELRPYNVRVSLVCPSEVKTAFGQENREELPEEAHKLRAQEIAHSIVGVLEMDDRGFVPELSVWATNPWAE